MRTEPYRRMIFLRRVVVAGAELAVLLTAVAPGSSQQDHPATQPAAPARTPHAITAQNQQFAEQSALLLKLATELKAEVDKTTKDTLSVAVIRKADEIEQMARGMRVAGGVKDKFHASGAGTGGSAGAN